MWPVEGLTGAVSLQKSLRNLTSVIFSDITVRVIELQTRGMCVDIYCKCHSMDPIKKMLAHG